MLRVMLYDRAVVRCVIIFIVMSDSNSDIDESLCAIVTIHIVSAAKS